MYMGYLRTFAKSLVSNHENAWIRGSMYGWGRFLKTNHPTHNRSPRLCMSKTAYCCEIKGLIISTRGGNIALNGVP